MFLQSGPRTFAASILMFLAACSSGGGGGGNDNSQTPSPNPPSPPTPAQPGQLQLTASTQSVSEASTTVTLTISRTAGASGAVGVVVSTGGGTATAGADYVSIATTVSFADGDAADKTVALTLTNDSADEPDETIVVTLSGITGGASLGGTTSTTVTIIDDDEAAAPAPTAATLAIGYATKRLLFTWSGSTGMTSYKFMAKEAAGQFVQLGADLPGDSTTFERDVPVHYYNWLFAVTQYRVDACNASGCTPSNIVDADAIGSILTTGYLKAADTSVNAGLGTAVAASADGKTLAIGAPGADGNAGAVYIYSVPADRTVPRPQPVKISPPSTQPMRFGMTVSLSRDGNTLAIGAPDDGNSAIGVGTFPTTPNNNSMRSGAVFIYSRVDGVWSDTPVFIKALDAEAEDAFGTAVSLSVDGKFLAVGAPGQDSPNDEFTMSNLAVDSGAAYAYALVDGEWEKSVLPFAFKAPNPRNGDRFGSAVAISEDGMAIVVGAPFEDDIALDAGTAYRFVRSTIQVTAWLPSPQRYTASTRGGTDDHYGAAVAISADGKVHAIGAPDDDSSRADRTDELSSNAGAVYVYTLSNLTASNPTPLLVDDAYIKAKIITEGARLGAALALSADGNALAAGAPADPFNVIGVDLDDRTQVAVNAGAVEFRLRRPNVLWSQPLIERTYVKASNTDADDLFGTAVGLSGDGNTLIVGAPGEDGSAVNFDAGNNLSDNSFSGAGAAYLY